MIITNAIAPKYTAATPARCFVRSYNSLCVNFYNPSSAVIGYKRTATKRHSSEISGICAPHVGQCCNRSIRGLATRGL